MCHLYSISWCCNIFKLFFKTTWRPNLLVFLAVPFCYFSASSWISRIYIRESTCQKPYSYTFLFLGQCFFYLFFFEYFLKELIRFSFYNSCIIKKGIHFWRQVSMYVCMFRFFLACQPRAVEHHMHCILNCSENHRFESGTNTICNKHRVL